MRATAAWRLSEVERLAHVCADVHADAYAEEHADVYAGVCHMSNAYAHVHAMLTYAHIYHMLTHTQKSVLTYADICWRMLTTARVGVLQERASESLAYERGRLAFGGEGSLRATADDTSPQARLIN